MMTLSIEKLIENEGIETLMQLVISPNKDFAAGLEALSRGVHPQTGEMVSPSDLFEKAEAEGLSLELEKLMIHKAIERFKPIYDENPYLLLFINISEACMAHSLENGFISESAKELGVPFSNIFFDVMSFGENQLEMVRQFVDLHRSQGFFVCIDNLGTSYSNIDKILYLNPDLVKVNINALRSMENDNYRRNMIHFLKLVTEQLGIIVVAKGIEDESDVNFTKECGAQFMQGFYISKPVDLRKEPLQAIVDRYRELMDSIYQDEENTGHLTRMLTSKVIGIINQIKNVVDFSNPEKISMNTDAIFESYPMVENLWILDEMGKQQGATVINHHYGVKNASMFHVYNHGSDFSSKEIYKQLFDTILDVWVTQPYRSILTNNVCIGCSVRINHSSAEAVLCMNINLDAMMNENKLV